MPRIPFSNPDANTAPIKVYNQPQVRLTALPEVRVAIPTGPNWMQLLGKGLLDLAQGLGQAEAASTHAEAVRVAGNTRAEMDAVIQRNSQKIADPEEFSSKTADALGELRDSAKSHENQLVGVAVGRMLERPLIGFNSKIETIKLGKQKDAAGAAVDESLATYSRAAINAPTEEERQDTAAGFRYFVGQMKGMNLLSAERAGDRLRAFDEQVIAGRKQLFSVGLTSQLQNIINDATTGKEPAGDLFAKGNAAIESFRDMNPAEIEKLKAAFKNDLWTGAIEGRIERDPLKADSQIRAGWYNDVLTPQSLRLLKDKSETAIERLARMAEAQRRETERQIGKLVSDYKEARMAGFDWRGPLSEAQLSRAVTGTEHEAEFRNVQAAGRVFGKFNTLNPADQEQYLRQLSSGAKTGDEAKFYNSLQAAHQKTKEALKNDPLTFAIRQGVISAPSPLQLNDGGKSLRERSLLAGVAEQRYGVPVSPLSDDEADRLRVSLEHMPADGKVGAFRSMRQGLEDRQIKLVAAQLAKKKDPVLALSMGLSLDAPTAARGILEGQDILQKEPKLGLTGAELTAARDRINRDLGETFALNVEHHAAVTDAALALYAQKSWKAKDQSGIFNKSRMEEAVREVTGGVLNVNGAKVQAPRYGMTEDDFKRLLGKADLSKARGVTASDVRKYGVFQSIGDGKYLIRIGPGFVHDQRGPFVLDLGEVSKRGAFVPASLGGAADFLPAVNE